MTIFESQNNNELPNLLGEGGLFASAINGFQARPQQQAMVEAVTMAIREQQTTVIEAGTGVGKTFAYLAPALYEGVRVVVSTGSKTLQDQLYFKDLPIIRKVLGRGIKGALLKGRANYLCLLRLEMTAQEGSFTDRRSISWLGKIQDWSGVTKQGDIAELGVVPRDAEIWRDVTSTPDNCVGADCDYYNDCFVVKARREAQEADVVVVNHHLFFADLALKERGFGELLPAADVVILDEAHQLPDIASNFFSENFSSRQLLDWARDTRIECSLNLPDMRQIPEQLDSVEKSIKDLRLAMDTPGQRAPWVRLRNKPAIMDLMGQLCDVLDALMDSLSIASERSSVLEASYEQLQLHRKHLSNMQVDQSNRIQWYETYTRGFLLSSTPLDIAEPLQQSMQPLPCTWIMTSATLAVGGEFEHFNARMGLESPKTLCLDSPFDYWHHSLLYLPASLPEPQQYDFVEALVDAAIPVINASQGRTFMLFTSYRALNEAAELLKEEIDFPILVQGESSQRDMIERFKRLGNAVLLGTASFWEGVDVQGEALSCVIIDKLPFAAPNDPVLEARMDAIRKEGKSPFGERQLPHAVITLKQGVGRLIRGHDDKGVLMICDTRLRTRSYGKTFLDSIPRMPRTQKLEVVQRFFKHHENSSA